MSHTQWCQQRPFDVSDHSPVALWCSIILSHWPPSVSVPEVCAVRLHCRGPMALATGPGRPDAGSGVPPAHPPLDASGGTSTSAHTRNGPPMGGGGGGGGDDPHIGHPIGFGRSSHERHFVDQCGSVSSHAVRVLNQRQSAPDGVSARQHLSTGGPCQPERTC